MESYRLIKKLHLTSDTDKDIAIKYDAPKIVSEIYGEATISGHFLLTTRHGKFPPLYEKQLEEKAPIWLNEMGLQEYLDHVLNELHLPAIITFTAPGVDPEKLELYFKFDLFLFLFDDAVLELNQLNKNDLAEQQKAILNVAKSLISIIESHGDDDVTEAAAAKLNPIFKSTCTVLSYVCKYSYKQMDEDDYKHLAKGMFDFIKVNKWRLEYNNSAYSEKEFYFLRAIDVGVSDGVFLICWAKGIRISNKLREHPIFRRFYNNVLMHVAITNDILSLARELPTHEKLNLVLVNCQKYSFQTSVSRAEKAANELIIELKKDKIRLMSYFPTDDNLKNFLETAMYIVDRFLYWHERCKRYGKIKYEKYVVEYNCDYNSWLDEIGITDVENMIEPELNSEFNK